MFSRQVTSILLEMLLVNLGPSPFFFFLGLNSAFLFYTQLFCSFIADTYSTMPAGSHDGLNNPGNSTLQRKFSLKFGTAL